MKRPLFVMNPDGSLREAADRQEFLAFMDADIKKIILQEKIYNVCEVTTSFLGREQLSTPKNHKPQKFFQTIVTGGIIDGSARLYATHEEAIAGHKSIISLIRGSIN